MPWMWDSGHLWGTWAWLLMPFMMALLWMPLILLCAWGARMLFGQGRPGAVGTATTVGADPDARELARRAYARGDLTRERFLQIIDDLDHTKGTDR